MVLSLEEMNYGFWRRYVAYTSFIELSICSCRMWRGCPWASKKLRRWPFSVFLCSSAIPVTLSRLEQAGENPHFYGSVCGFRCHRYRSCPWVGQHARHHQFCHRTLLQMWGARMSSWVVRCRSTFLLMHFCCSLLPDILERLQTWRLHEELLTYQHGDEKMNWRRVNNLFDISKFEVLPSGVKIFVGPKTNVRECCLLGIWLASGTQSKWAWCVWFMDQSSSDRGCIDIEL